MRKSPLLTVVSSFNDFLPDSATEIIIEEILHLKNLKTEKGPGSDPSAEFAIFMDFDGTIIDGDITDGRVERVWEGPERRLRSAFDGLAKHSIMSGLAHTYQGEEGWTQYWEKYFYLLQHHEWESVQLVGEVFSALPPQQREKIILLREEQFQKTFKQNLFSSSLQIIESMKAHDIHVFIISASPQIFVEGASSILPIPADHIFGIDSERDFYRSSPFMPYAQGKITRMKAIIEDFQMQGLGAESNQGQGKKLIPLAGFGNSWVSDGPFLKEISLMGGLGVMINGGKKNEESKELFCVHQHKVLGDLF